MYKVDINRDIFHESHETPIAVMFYANWCGPCQALKPQLVDLSKKAGRDWKLELVNVEDEPGLTNRLNIKSIPTIFLFHEEEPIARITGSKPIALIENWIHNNLPNKRYSGEYRDIDQDLNRGDVDSAKDRIMDLIMEQYSNAPLIRILRALDSIGKNNKQAKRRIEEVDDSGPFGNIIKKVKDIIEMEDDEADVQTPTSSPYHHKARNIDERIDVNAIDFALLNDLVHLGINEVRNKKGVQDLRPHPILYNAALDHNNYQMRYDQLTHYQNNPSKKSVKERILSFGGHDFRMMGENVQYKGFPSRVYGNRREIITGSYRESAIEIVTNWVNSPGHYKNLINVEFVYVGTAVGWNPENASLFATQVFGA